MKAPGFLAVIPGVFTPPAGPDVTAPTICHLPLSHLCTDIRVDAGSPETWTWMGSATETLTTGASATVSPAGLVTRTTEGGSSGRVVVVPVGVEMGVLGVCAGAVMTGCSLTTCTEDCGAPEPEPLLLGGVETGRVGPGREHDVVVPETTG